MTDHMPHWQPNDKKNWTGPADSRWSVGNDHKYFTGVPNDPYPAPERYGWMTVLVVACTILAVAIITWRVYNPPASAEWVAK